MELAQWLGLVGLEHGAACGMCKMARGYSVLLWCGNCPARALLLAHRGVNKGSAPPEGPATTLGAEIISGSSTQHWKGRGLGRHRCNACRRQLHCHLHRQ